jgi:YwiC-like protein
MLIVPFVVGTFDAGPSWRQLPLLFAWLVGYFAFFAAGLWLGSRGKHRYAPPVRTYGVLTVVVGVVVIAVQPGVLHWAVVFLPLLAFSLWCSWRRADRSLLNDGVTVLAACLMTVVATGFGERLAEPGTAALSGLAWLPGADQGRARVLAGLLLAYFAGTVLYVKTMIRDRADPGRYPLSVMFHVAVCVPAAVASPVGGAFRCPRHTGHRRAQAMAGADSGNDRRRRDRRESDPGHHAVARLSADPAGTHSGHFTRSQIARATSLLLARCCGGSQSPGRPKSTACVPPAGRPTTGSCGARSTAKGRNPGRIRPTRRTSACTPPTHVSDGDAKLWVWCTTCRTGASSPVRQLVVQGNRVRPARAGLHRVLC